MLLVIVSIIAVGYFAVVNIHKKQSQSPVPSNSNKGVITETYKTSTSTNVTLSYSPDQKRESDIEWLQTQAQAFYSTWSYYPSLADMNNSTFIASKMPGISAHLTDPSNPTKSQVLASTPTKNQYSYQVTDKSGASCEANDQLCVKYTFTAMLSNGSLFQKSNLN